MTNDQHYPRKGDARQTNIAESVNISEINKMFKKYELTTVPVNIRIRWQKLSLQRMFGSWPGLSRVA